MTWTPALAAEAAKLIADVTPLLDRLVSSGSINAVCAAMPRALSLLDAAMKRIAEVEMLHDQVGTVLSEEIDTLRARAEAAETALAEARRLGDAMATRKDYGHSGYCCRLCGQVWEEGERERHTPTCPVAAWREWRE